MNRVVIGVLEIGEYNCWTYAVYSVDIDLLLLDEIGRDSGEQQIRRDHIIMSNNNHIEEDEQFRQVFNGECDISEECLDTVGDIKNNHPYRTHLYINSNEDILTELAWRLLGGYIANNTHLTQIMFEGGEDARISTLFESFVRSSSIKALALDDNHFGINGVQEMLPLLLNSPQLVDLSIINNVINTECFELLVSTLHNNTCIERLIFGGCNITNIRALETYNLPNLNTLSLASCNIGREGCIVISNQLQREGSTLRGLYLNNTGMGDDEAELLVTSLKHNTKLELITLAHNEGITDRGHVAFLKLLNDVSSIESTYHSNSTLTTCIVSTIQYDRAEMSREGSLVQGRGTLILIEEACNDNQKIDAGKAKVIRSHLNSQTLKRLCQLQGIEYSYSNIFADIEPVLLPKILALIGDRHGHSELYTALIQTAPDLLSYIDRKALIQDVVATNTAHAAALKVECEQKVAEYERKIAALKTEMLIETSHITAQNNGLINRLAFIELGDSKQTATGECNGDKREIGGSGDRGNSKKRGRERNEE